jgi:hypothetical protein
MPRHTDLDLANVEEKKNKWDRLAPPSYSPSAPPEPPDVADSVRTRSEKLLDEVAVGAIKSSNSEIQESTGAEVGDMAAGGLMRRRGTIPVQKEEEKRR